ncbi:NADP-dependent oxidoreductase [Roseateles noduli]|jgi:NADPH:quinone reductase-like Zn-dependent oxidoreductase|uniref:NADP-dependent oxidoreductase n=1 Tax=Roseateles noduli TaxID=2052484 RepID=UPI003D6473EF
MKGVIQDRFGAPDVLQVAEAPRPTRLFTEVLLKVHAASINRVDLLVRSGVFPLLGKPPFILGWDLSGVVEEVELGSTRFKVGDEVFGMPLFPRAANAYSEYTAAPSRQLWLKPASLTHVQAAALPMAGLTALQALDDIAKLQAGQRVLILGAGGGVGHIAVQIAKALGAEVFATASAAKHDFVKSLGADHLIDYKTTDFASVVSDADVVFDIVGGDNAQRSLQVLKPGGIVVTTEGLSTGNMPALAASVGRRFSSVAVEADGAGLERLVGWVNSGQLNPHVSATFSLKDAALAHALVAKGDTQGKVVLDLQGRA